ncbi:serine/threonine-protein kinase TBK1-like isoform X2 [Liolophura sinensis]|uniref:serine/threonine-protein kinase TBK1-like isoform X2 n=1 Tax=Liolophura sinensis TaxID=3198878 RepID=UPI0031594886
MLRDTTNHIYKVSDLLGKGATCSVYKGVDKKTGKERALKIFNVSLPTPVKEALRREVDALKTLSHPNVVTFLSLETERTSRHKVLVMELCAGTLLNVLSEPQHAYGLREDEFLLFFNHMVSGLKHLRLNGFVHRDIKPGNILRSIGEDGKSVYKLSDFGSAKKLDLDEESFMSMYGTEEYLHPDIFEKAFIDRSAQKQFTLAVDLWSIGATLYHAVTGSIPFRPYDGRRDKETMFEMIGRKETGIISGVQETPNGEIYWSNDLPASCCVSENLKTVLREMCAGMMERDPRRMWTFETFFCEAERLFEKERIFIFSTLDCSFMIAYLCPSSHLCDLKKEIQRQKNIDMDKQILLWKEKPIEEHITQEMEVIDFPKTDSSRPLILFGMCTMEGLPLSPITIEEFPSSTGGIEEDFRTAKHSLEVQHGLKKVMDQCRVSQEFLVSGASALNSHMMSQVTNLGEKVERELTVTRQAHRPIESSLSILKSRHKEESIDRDTYDFADAGSLETQLCQDLQHVSDSLSKVISGLEETKVWCKAARDELGGYLATEKALELTYGLKVICPRDCECVTSAKWQMDEIKTLTHKFDERRRHPHISFHQEQLNTFDKLHLADVCQKSLLLLNEHCLPANENVFRAFKSWHSVFRLKRLEFDRKTKQTLEKMKEVQELQSQYHTIQTGVLSKYMKTAPTSVGADKTRFVNHRKKQHRHNMVKALETSLVDSATDSEFLRQEMTSLQESCICNSCV